MTQFIKYTKSSDEPAIRSIHSVCADYNKAYGAPKTIPGAYQFYYYYGKRYTLTNRFTGINICCNLAFSKNDYKSDQEAT